MKKIILSLTALALISCGGSSSRSSDSGNYRFHEDDDEEYYDPEPTEEIEVQSTVTCPNCNGRGRFPCMNCGGRGYNPEYNPYGGYYQNVPCGVCGGMAIFTCQVCDGDGYIERTTYQPSFKGGATTTFVKTSHSCDKCSCDGYHGIKHANGAYEGNCQNTDNWGHKCNHSPEHHGLRAWK